MKNQHAFDLIKNRPTAFTLLSLIALRAKRSNEEISELKIGQAYVGDYKSYGVTEQIYRTDKAMLESCKLATFKGTKKGTIATLLDKRLFDTNENINQRTDKRDTNEIATTNKKTRIQEDNLSKDKLVKTSQRDELVEKVLSLYQKHTGNLPTDKYPRRVAHNIAQITTTLIKDIRPHYPSARIGELTTEFILEKAFDWYFGQLKDDVEVTKLDTVKLNIRARFYEASRKKYVPNYKLNPTP